MKAIAPKTKRAGQARRYVDVCIVGCMIPPSTRVEKVTVRPRTPLSLTADVDPSRMKIEAAIAQSARLPFRAAAGLPSLRVQSPGVAVVVMAPVTVRTNLRRSQTPNLSHNTRRGCSSCVKLPSTRVEKVAVRPLAANLAADVAPARMKIEAAIAESARLPLKAAAGIPSL